MVRLLKQVWFLLLMMGLGTLIDWAVHSSHDAWYVEPEYFRNKVIFGVIWGVFGLYVLKRIGRINTPKALALGVPAFIALFLQTKYFYQGRALDFVFIFLFLHYLMFLPAAFFIFNRYRTTLLDPAPAVPQKPRWGLLVVIVIALEAVFWLFFHLFPPF